MTTSSVRSCPRGDGAPAGVLRRAARAARAKAPSLLDTAPLADTLRKIIAFDQLARNVDAGVLASVAVVATSYATGDSVVFHHSHATRTVPTPDIERAIRYAPTRLTDVHVRASAAIPVAFPAIRVGEPAAVSGWYGDGGTRLNTPIKPALKLGAKRIVVIGLNSSAVPAQPVPVRPDVFDELRSSCRRCSPIRSLRMSRR